MMTNEKGAILPLALILVSIFALLFFSQLHLYLVEKKFTTERYELEHLENIKQMAIVDIIHIIQQRNDSKIFIQSSLHYPIGTVDYDISPALEADVVTVSMSCYTNNNRKNTATWHYNVNQHLIIAYYES